MKIDVGVNRKDRCSRFRPRRDACAKGIEVGRASVPVKR